MKTNQGSFSKKLEAFFFEISISINLRCILTPKFCTPKSFIVKILKLYIILSCTQLYHFFPVSILYISSKVFISLTLAFQKWALFDWRHMLSFYFLNPMLNSHTLSCDTCGVTCIFSIWYTESLWSHTTHMAFLLGLQAV